ncbi:Dyp-type peroxidase [Pseudomonas sp. NPDC007930]|uniref:Dyp-type peroxidase n=1 Tax=Pseudomonas sp. NPDC007930 TaxID=3364417 RepID=UPI0036EB2F38
MPFNLNTPLDDSNLDAPATRHLLQALQANILKGHGRNHVVLLFLEITDVAKARHFMHHYKVTSAATQFQETRRFKDTGEPGGVVRLAFISHAGLVQFGKAAPFAPGGTPLDEFFVQGMAADTAALDRQTTDSWQSALKRPVHVLLLLAHDDLDDLSHMAFSEVQTLNAEASGFELLLAQEGRAYFNKAGAGIEHFGYVDGRSQPLMTTSDIAAEKGAKADFVYDPTAPLKQFMFDDPLAPGEGLASLFVFRKLEQDVASFKAAEEAIQGALTPPPSDDELAGAMVVGRFENGVPVTLQPPPPAAPVDNDFNYNADPDGARCPFQGHIRKTNPRGSSPGGEVFDKGVQMARRGITYGLRLQDPATAEFVDQPNDGVGLLFMSYQASIKDQFHFMQESWANNRKFPKFGPADPFVGIDPIIGQVLLSEEAEAATDHVWPSPAPHAQKNFSGFVHLKGGEYFYTPSPRGLKHL